MKKKFYNLLMLPLVSIFVPGVVAAQLYIGSGTGFYIASNDYVSVSGDADINESIQGTGTLLLNGTAAQNVNAHGFSIPAAEINNTSGITLTGAATIGNSLVFTAGTVTLGGNNLSFNTGAAITGHAAGKHLVTNGAGVVTATTVAASGNFVFPVGFTASSYSPLSVTNGATPQTINVAVKDYSSSAANETSANGIDRSWQLYTSAGGAVSSLSLTHDATLNGSNYYAGGAFITRQQATAGRWSNPNSASYGGIVTALGEAGTTPTLASVNDTYHSNTLVLGSTATSAAAANSWYSKASRAAGINTAAGSIALNVTALLQGAFNSGTGTMSNTLQTSSLLPTASTTAYTSSPRADYNSINNTGGAAGTVTDWIEVQLRDATTPATVVERQALLVKPNGQVQNEAGASSVLFASAPGNYFITVSHRNHLSIRSAAAQSFTAGTTVTYDFTTAQSQAYQNPAITTNAAMALSGSKYVLWGGNGNGNNTVRYIGPSNDNTYLLSTVLGGNSATILSNVYNNGDYNMNGVVRYIGPANDNTVLLSTVLGGNSSLIITQH